MLAAQMMERDNDQGNPVAAADVENTKTVQPPLGLTDLLGDCSVAVH